MPITQVSPSRKQGKKTFLKPSQNTLNDFQELNKTITCELLNNDLCKIIYGYISCNICSMDK